jgi:hypothetical protein
MAEKKAEQLNFREGKLCHVGPVQVFTRRDDDGRPTIVDAIHEDKDRIFEIADRLQRSGYGVKRRRKPRAGRTYYALTARWAGEGEPPEQPLGDEA